MQGIHFHPGTTADLGKSFVGWFTTPSIQYQVQVASADDMVSEYSRRIQSYGLLNADPLNAAIYWAHTAEGKFAANAGIHHPAQALNPARWSIFISSLIQRSLGGNKTQFPACRQIPGHTSCMNVHQRYQRFCLAENTHMQLDKDKLTVNKSTVYLSTSSSAKHRVASHIGIARCTSQRVLRFWSPRNVRCGFHSIAAALWESRQGLCLRIWRFSLQDTNNMDMAQPILFDSIYCSSIWLHDSIWFYLILFDSIWFHLILFDSI